MRQPELVAGSPTVHECACLIGLHAVPALLDFTRCSPSCSSYLRRTFFRLSCTYNQLTHSHQQSLPKMIQTLRAWRVIKARMPAFGLIGIRMMIIGIPLQTWMGVIVDVDVYVRLSLEIYGPWRADYIEWPLPGQGHVPPLQYPPL